MRAKLNHHSFLPSRGEDNLGSLSIQKSGPVIVSSSSSSSKDMTTSSSSCFATSLSDTNINKNKTLRMSPKLLGHGMLDTTTTTTTSEPIPNPPKKRLSLLDMAEAATLELERRLSLTQGPSATTNTTTTTTSTSSTNNKPYHHNTFEDASSSYGQFTTTTYDQVIVPSEEQPQFVLFQPLFSQIGCATTPLLTPNTTTTTTTLQHKEEDATEAAMQAVKMAIDQCCINPIRSNIQDTLVIQMKLGVPSSLGVHLASITKSIPPHFAKILPIQVVPGGLLSHNHHHNQDEYLTTTFCTVVAHVSIGYEKMDPYHHHHHHSTRPVVVSSPPQEEKDTTTTTTTISKSSSTTQDNHHHLTHTLTQVLGQNELMLREKMELESKIDILQKRLALRDESIELLAKNGDDLQLQLHLASTSSSQPPSSSHIHNPPPPHHHHGIINGTTDFYNTTNTNTNGSSQFVTNTNTTLNNNAIHPNATITNQVNRTSTLSPIVPPSTPKSSSHTSPIPTPNTNSYTTQVVSGTSTPSSATMNHHTIVETKINVHNNNNNNNNKNNNNNNKKINNKNSNNTNDNNTMVQDSNSVQDVTTTSEDGTYDDASMSTTMSDSALFNMGKKRKLLPGFTAKENLRQFVQHKYHDHSNEPVPPQHQQQNAAMMEDSTDDKKRKKNNSSFPKKLHALLDEVSGRGEEMIVSWRPHGRAFIVHKPKVFVEKIMSRHFLLTKYCSFLRQLNLYGFHRFSSGIDKGSYYHELFLRGLPFLCDRMVRTRVNGNGIRSASNPDYEPNFYQMTFLPSKTPTATTNDTAIEAFANASVTATEEDMDDDLTEGSESVNDGDKKGVCSSAFPLKLHFMLDKIEEGGRSDIVSWQPHNRSFIVHNPEDFAREVMPNFFRQTKYSSFQRQLHMYGFQRISAGRDKGAYYHEFFLRGKPSLCNKMVRKRVNGKGCRKPSNPSNEPNFYEMQPILLENSDKSDSSLDENANNNKSPSSTTETPSPSSSMFTSTPTLPRTGVNIAQT